ncbi:MAG: Hsp20/alpha crystallin family protein [Phycisphaerae bacterium]
MALPARLTRSILEPADLLRREMDDMFGRFLGEARGDGGSPSAGFPVDIRETATALIVDAELPGFNRDEIDVTVENQMLTITAEHAQQPEQLRDDARQYLLRERRFRRFGRSFSLPNSVDDNQVQAKYENGMLHIEIAKREEVKPRRIAVS